MKKVNSKISGFTLIEMVVVIAVIGVLMTIAFRGTGAIQAGARDVKRVKALNDMRALLEQYYATEGSYPIHSAAATACDPKTKGADSWSGLAAELQTKKIIDQVADVQNDPSVANKQYCYGSADGSTYRITASPERNVPKDNVIDAGGVTNVQCGTVGVYCLKP